MVWKKSLVLAFVLAAIANGVQASPSDYVSSNIPLSSPFYGYIEKFDGMGYLKSMTTGTKPYTRMQMAQWVTEIQKEAKDRPLPIYLEGMKQELERELASELMILDGISVDVPLKLRQFRLELGSYDGEAVRYRMNNTIGNIIAGPRANYQSLNTNNNGYRYGDGGNFVASTWLSGKFGQDLAVSVEPRVSYDDDQHGKVSLMSGYVTTRVNGTALQLGRDAVFWGHGATGSLILGNNMTPLTSVKFSNLEPYTTKGFFKFLGEMNFIALYSQMESNRTHDNKREVDNPSFVGFRGTFTPQRNFTFGLSVTSMVKGVGFGDLEDFVLGRNADAEDDKWNSIGGLDFKVRLPHWGGVQLYGELYGEDQSNYMPSKIAERAGIYIPKISRDGSWDMKVEYVHTSSSWYQHQKFTNGYVYKGDIIGDPVGNNANQYYVQIGHYLNKDSKISFNGSYLSQDRDAAIQQEIKSLWLQYETKLRDRMFLDGQVGVSRIDNANFSKGNRENNHFAGVSVRWVY